MTLLIIAFIFTLLSISLLLISPINGLLVTLAFKPVIDATWDKSFMGINLLHIVGIAVPLFILPRIILSSKKRFFDMKLAWMAVVLFFVNIIGVIGLLNAGEYYSSLDYFSRVLNTLIAFFLFQYYFTEKESFRKLLLVLLVAGLFPVFVGIYQAITGHIWRPQVTSLGMVRYAGLYHDAVSIRIFGFQTLGAIILYWSYFVNKKFWQRFFLSAYALACAFVIFRAYTKTGMLNLIVWAVVWSVFTRKIHWLIIISILILTINLATGNKIIKDTERVFMKELGAYEDTMDDKYILAGRTMIWKDALKNWEKADIFKKMFGSGDNPPVHNEYLRMLICNGIFGLLAFFFSIIYIAIRMLINVLGRASPLNVVALMVFVMLFLDTLGLHPGLYPAYQWYVYGIITLSLTGVNGLEFNKKLKIDIIK